MNRKIFIKLTLAGVGALITLPFIFVSSPAQTTENLFVPNDPVSQSEIEIQNDIEKSIKNAFNKKANDNMGFESREEIETVVNQAIEPFKRDGKIKNFRLENVKWNPEEPMGLENGEVLFQYH